MPDQYESDTMRQLRSEYPHLFRGSEASAAETATAVTNQSQEPRWNTDMGRRWAERYTDALSRRWFMRNRDRIMEETEGRPDWYMDRMRRLQERYPEVQRLRREQIVAGQE